LRYQQHPASHPHVSECINIFSAIGDLRGITYSYYDISKAYLQVGLLAEAIDYCFQSLNTALTLDNIPLTLHALHGFAHLYAKTDQHERALRLCNLVADHPQVDDDTHKRAIVTKVELETILPADVVQAAHLWAESISLQDVIEQIRAETPSSRK
jgi:hypothetical protein